MRKLPKQNSPDNLIEKSSSNELFSYKVEPFSKSFRKKYQLIQPNTVNSSSNLVKTFSKNSIKPSQLSRESPTKAVERRSHSKNQQSRQPEKISLTSYQYHQANSMSTAAKLLKINNIFCRRLEGKSQQILVQLYQQNDEYLQLLFEWQKLEIYDEIDKLVYKLSQNYAKMVESAIEQAYRETDSQLARYQTLMLALQQENSQLKSAINKSQGIGQLLAEVQNRVAQEHHKNQWSNIVLHEFSRQNFDLEGFFKATPTYRKIVFGGNANIQGILEGEIDHQNYGLLRKIELEKQGKLQQDIRLTKSQANSQSSRGKHQTDQPEKQYSQQ